jgi:hypothetical protein
MAQYPENYGQYSQQGEYSGLNIEDQSVAPPTGAVGSWGSGYNPQQPSWSSDVPAVPSNTQFGAPPVQPMYNDPQYSQFQQGEAHSRTERHTI